MKRLNYAPTKRGAQVPSPLALSRRRWRALTILSFIGIACDDTTSSPVEPPAIYTIEKAATSSGDLQRDTVLATLEPLRVVVRVDDVVTAGVAVNWLISADTVTDTSTTITDANGVAALVLKLGSKPAVYAVRATLERTVSEPSVTFTVTAIAGNAAALAITSGANQSDTATALLSIPYTVQATDAYGNRVAGVAIDWRVTAGGGSISPAQSVTSEVGEASARHTLGPAHGVNEVTASALGISTPVTFRATGTAARPTLLKMTSGNNQSAQTNLALAADYVVRVSDSYDNPIVGIEVEWTIVTGGGTLSSSRTVTGPDGSAAIRLTLGPTVGAQSVSATATGLPSAPHVVFTSTAVAPPPPPPPPQDALLTVRISSTGVDLDGAISVHVARCSNVYSCTGAWRSQTAGANATVQFFVPPGEYGVFLSDIAANCTVSENFKHATPSVSVVTEVSFTVSCVAAGSIRVTTNFTGIDAPSHYEISVDGQSWEPVSASGSLVVSGLVTGTHTIAVYVSGNCTVAGSNPASVTVTQGATANVSFSISCVANPTLRVTVTATGTRLPAFFTVGVSTHIDHVPTAFAQVAPNTTSSIRIPVGSHSVYLVASPGCGIAGGSTREIQTTLGATADVSFSVDCLDDGFVLELPGRRTLVSVGRQAVTPVR